MWENFIERHLGKEKLMGIIGGVEEDRNGNQLKNDTCPFSDPTFTLDPTIPCPVCGALGGFGMGGQTADELCVD